MGVRKIIRNHIARSCLIILLLLSVLLVPVSSQDPEPNIEYILGMNELPGGIVSPGGASSFRFEYEHNGERLLFWGWTGPNDIRVMGEDLTTLHIIDLPSESFDVRDAKWSHGGSIIVLGNNGTGAEDTLLVYRTPLFEQNPTFLPREAIPLVTIDAASPATADSSLCLYGVPSGQTAYNPGKEPAFDQSHHYFILQAVHLDPGILPQFEIRVVGDTDDCHCLCTGLNDVALTHG